MNKRGIRIVDHRQSTCHRPSHSTDLNRSMSTSQVRNSSTLPSSQIRGHSDGTKLSLINMATLSSPNSETGRVSRPSTREICIRNLPRPFSHSSSTVNSWTDAESDFSFPNDHVSVHSSTMDDQDFVSHVKVIREHEEFPTSSVSFPLHRHCTFTEPVNLSRHVHSSTSKNFKTSNFT